MWPFFLREKGAKFRLYRMTLEFLTLKVGKPRTTSVVRWRHHYITYSAAEEELMGQYRKNIGKVKENLERMLPEIGLTGQWSMDIMQNGNDFYLIDMALAENSGM